MIARRLKRSASGGSPPCLLLVARGKESYSMWHLAANNNSFFIAGRIRSTVLDMFRNIERVQLNFWWEKELWWVDGRALPAKRQDLVTAWKCSFGVRRRYNYSKRTAFRLVAHFWQKEGILWQVSCVLPIKGGDILYADLLLGESCLLGQRKIRHIWKYTLGKYFLTQYRKCISMGKST
jgi:hypothetical protein